jgi:hypothetical protein
VSLVVGTPMIRVDDGVRGAVELASPPGMDEARYREPRIVYYDRGERRVAGKTEKWVIEQTPGSKMRTEEMLLVAYAADRQLECLDKHLPDKHWEPLANRRGIHDLGLVEAIVAYLKTRV